MSNVQDTNDQGMAHGTMIHLEWDGPPYLFFSRFFTMRAKRDE